jgi:hypothetical protein
MKSLRLILLIVLAVISNVTFARDTGLVSAKTQTESLSLSEDAKYAAYSVDGITSASKLAAQRSHTVAGKDERNFAIFTGITVIFMIYFFSQFDFFNK